MYNLKFHSIMQSSGTIVILRFKNEQKYVLVSNTKYTKDSTKFGEIY